MSLQPHEAKLDDHLQRGILKEIIEAGEAKAFAVAIGEHSEKINSNGYGYLFSRLQHAYSIREDVAIANIFSNPQRNYETRCIRSVLEILEANAFLWTLPGRDTLVRKMIEAGHLNTNNTSIPNAELTKLVVSHYKGTHPTLNGTDAISTALTKIKTHRDKVIAHNEAIQLIQLSTWGEATLLVDYAKEFFDTIAHGFAGFTTKSHFGPHSSMTARQKGMAEQLKRLLRELEDDTIHPQT